MNRPAGRAIVIGGSLAGLFAGLLLRRQFAVDIYERADAGLAGRGAGIVTQSLLWEALDAAGIAWRQGLGIEVRTRRFFEPGGRLGLEHPYRQTVTAWDRLYDMLCRAFSPERYHRAKELVAVEERRDGVAARFADGSVAEADLLVGADGLRSTVRAQFLPGATPIYAGYAAWRALVPEHAIAPDLHAQVFDHMAFCLPPGEQMLGYPVAGPDNDLRPGHRRYNLVWYRPADEIQLRRLLTDEAGTLHAVSIPPPSISRAVVADMREAAEAVLAPQFRDLIRLVGQPMLQAIYDIESPRMAFGRRIIARARELGACLQPHHATAAERANADRFRTPAATLRETATLEFLEG